LMGVKTNVGGVGIAMLLLICARLYMQRRAWLPQMTERGVEYWGAMYIPVVVAMAAQQDVVAALRGGPVAVLAAIGSVIVCGAVISLMNRMETARMENPSAAEADSMLVKEHRHA
jgi:malonate transporter MadL subunit